MVIAYDAESPTLRAQFSERSGPVTRNGEANAAYKPSENKYSQMWNLEDITKLGEERLCQDWRHEVRTANCYLDFSDKYIEILSCFESIWDIHLCFSHVANHWVTLFPADEK